MPYKWEVGGDGALVLLTMLTWKTVVNKDAGGLAWGETVILDLRLGVAGEHLLVAHPE